MYQQQVRYIINLLMIVDALIVIGAVYAASYINWVLKHYDWRLDDLDAGYIALFLVFANNFIFGRMGLYSDRRPQSFLTTVRLVVISVAILFTLFTGVLYALKVDVSRLFALICAGIMVVSFIVERALLEIHLAEQQRAGFNCHRILLVGSEDRIRALQEALVVQSSWGHKIIGYVPEKEDANYHLLEIANLGAIEDIGRILTERSVDEVIFALSPECVSVNLREKIDLCEEVGTTYRIIPALYDPVDRLNLRVEAIQGIPTLVKRTIRINVSGTLYKRIFDYMAGGIGFLTFVIMYPIVGLIIKLDSPGPVMFKQPRVGEHGRIFYIYKFRTMVVNAEQQLSHLLEKNEMKGHMFKMTNDPRITKVGAFLRKTSLDEFPQFINVIRGEMSMVGTRPPTTVEVAKYEARHRRRIAIKPGITGLWQISGRNKIEDFEEVLKLDLQYIDNWRFIDDMIIILKTVVVVLARKGAS